MNRELRQALKASAEGRAYLARQESAKRARARRVGAKPAVAPGPTKAERDAARDARWKEIKDRVFQRAWLLVRPCCEVVDERGRPCTNDAATVDHFWSGHGRRRALESVESCWALCAEHDQMRTLNSPTRLFWVGLFEAHVLRHGLRTQLSLIAAERARLEGKRRG